MASKYPSMPPKFLTVRVDRLDLNPSLIAWCVGYEMQEWRAEGLAKHMLEWLPEFALKYSEWANMDAGNAYRLIGKAAGSVYKSENYQRRGEFGEILLHAMIRQRFNSVPAISKYYYKDSSNDTIKGFDAVHVVKGDEGWDLWLGEVKFYSDINQAIRDVVKELKEHMNRDYLRSEFIAIVNKLDAEWEEATQIAKMIDANTSLDSIFKSICIPVLLTYDSSVVKSYVSVCAEYELGFVKEVLEHREAFAKKELPQNIEVRLFLLPIKSKVELVYQMDEALKKCQAAH